jgi:F-type H+-transporting ATPase subunit a
MNERTMRKRLALLLAVVVALLGTAPAAQAAAGDETLDIVGHTADGFYLDFLPLGTIELPRIMLVRGSDGSLRLDAYGSTAAMLRSGEYGAREHSEGGGEEGGHGEPHLVSEQSGLIDMIDHDTHLHAEVVPLDGHAVADFSITRHLIFGLLAMALVLGLFIPLARRYERGPGRKSAPDSMLQNMFEAVVVFIRDDVAKPNIGPRYKKFLPFLLSAFFFILFANILGLVPWAGAATSNIGVTLVLALCTFFLGHVYASKQHWKHLFLGPSDAPTFIRVILVPIEILGTVARHAALAIRLFANMMGGTLVILALVGMAFIINALIGPAAAWGAGIVSTAFTVFVLGLKLLVAFIQAYIFTILSALFIGMAVDEHGAEGEIEEVSAEEGRRTEITPVSSGNGTLDQHAGPPDGSDEPVPATAS